MTELSPEAQKVFEAFNSKFEWVEDGVPGPQFKGIAAALRAAVLCCEEDALVILSLADELESQ